MFAQHKLSNDTRSPSFIASLETKRAEIRRNQIAKTQPKIQNKSLDNSQIRYPTIYKPPQLISLLDTISKIHNVDPHLVRAIAQAESSFNPNAVSHAGAMGIMQLMPKTAKRFGVTDPFCPIQNVIGGVKYLQWLLDFFNGDAEKAIAAYNAGENAVIRHSGIPPFNETRNYVPKVMSLWKNQNVQPLTVSINSMAQQSNNKNKPKPIQSSSQPVITRVNYHPMPQVESMSVQLITKNQY